MLKPLTLAAILLATAAPMAHAQDSDDDNGGGDRLESSERGDDRGDPPMRDMRRGDRWASERDGGEDEDGPRERDRRRDRDGDRWERRADDRGPRMRGPHHGPGDRRGPPPPPRAGFEIRLGPGQVVRVDCGDEDFARCVDAAKPILDSAREMTGAGPGGPVTQVPPPPADLVDPPGEGGNPPPAPAN